jgi:hypothetical protein
MSARLKRKKAGGCDSDEVFIVKIIELKEDVDP